MKSLWLVTFVTHNSRLSDRMINVGVQKGLPLVLTPAQINLVAEALVEAWTRHKIPVCACNVLPDHVHAVIAAESEEELHELVRKLKGFSSHRLSQADPSIAGALWQQKFNRKVIPDEGALNRALEYVWNNHRKHLPHEVNSGKGLKPPCLTKEVYTVDMHEAIVERLRQACITVQEIFSY